MESGEKDSEGKTTPRSLRHLPYKDASGKIDLPHLRNAISRANQIILKDGTKISESKANSLKSRAQKLLASAGKDFMAEMESSVLSEQKTFFAKLKDFIFGPDPEPDFTVYKDESGRWAWKGVYSNTLVDRDNETLTADAHKAYATLVAEDYIPAPKLLLWHTWGPGEIGIADRIWFDDSTSTAWAMGHFHESKSAQAEALSSYPDLGMSHGMPMATIHRNDKDHSIIERYISTELTVLPNRNAANTATAFSSKLVFTKEENMSQMTEERKKFLADMQFSEEEINFINNLKEKEVVEKEGEETPTPEVETTPEAAETKEEPLRDEVAEALVAISTAIKDLATITGELKKDVAALKATDAEKIAEKAEDTPRMSLAELVQASVLGQEAAKLDGRKSLAKEGPKETEPETPNQFGIPFINQMVAGEDWAKAFKEGK